MANESGTEGMSRSERDRAWFCTDRNSILFASHNPADIAFSRFSRKLSGICRSKIEKTFVKGGPRMDDVRHVMDEFCSERIAHVLSASLLHAPKESVSERCMAWAAENDMNVPDEYCDAYLIDDDIAMLERFASLFISASSDASDEDPDKEKSEYEIRYNICGLSDDDLRDQEEFFTGTRSEMLERIRELKKSGCWNISAEPVSERQ